MPPSVQQPPAPARLLRAGTRFSLRFWVQAALLLFSVCWAACHTAPTPISMPQRFASSQAFPEPADILMGCNNDETDGLLSLLQLDPPWRDARSETMLELGLALERGKEENCLRAARFLWFELASAYPKNKAFPRAILGLGLTSLQLKEPFAEMEKILSFAPNRETALLEAAQRGTPQGGVLFLSTYAGAASRELLGRYVQWLRKGGMNTDSVFPDGVPGLQNPK